MGREGCCLGVFAGLGFGVCCNPSGLFFTCLNWQLVLPVVHLFAGILLFVDRRRTPGYQGSEAPRSLGTRLWIRDRGTKLHDVRMGELGWLSMGTILGE